MSELSPHATTPREPMARKIAVSGLPKGASIGGYTIIASLGGGGMGRVYLAEDEKLDRKVALKVLPPEDADDEGRARFLREAQALARVHHKNVVQVFASGVDEDVAWMALEYVEGEALGTLLEGGAVDEETALSLCAQAARGLSAVHEVGVVHRDVKPDNLLLDEHGVVRVVDFGVALFVDPSTGRGGFVTQKGVAIGTPHFMAPEQARGGVVDARADAWGLGATLFTLLSGRPPFYAKDDEADLDILARVLRDRAPDVRARRPQVSAATSSLLAKLLEPEAEKRVSDMAAIAAAFDEIADALAAGAPPEAAPTVEPGSSAEPVAPVVATAESPLPRAEPASSPKSEAAVAASSPSTSALRMLALAASFAALGAVVAFQLARTGPSAAPAHVEHVEHVEASTAPPPQPPSVAPPVESHATPAAATPLEDAAKADAKADDDKPAEPPPPNPDDLAAQVLADPVAHKASLDQLVGLDTNDAKAAVVQLAMSSAGDVTLDTIASSRALQHIGAIEKALFDGNRARALHAIDILVELRPFEALDILDRASKTHKDKAIRAKALAAREALFHVEGG
jgi:serine/threonine-protein kinase